MRRLIGATLTLCLSSSLLTPALATPATPTAATPSKATTPSKAGTQAVAGTPAKAVYDVGLRSNASGTQWRGRQKVYFTNTSATPLKEIYLRLWGNGLDGCGTASRPSPVRVGRLTGGKPAPLTVDCSALRIDLPRPLRRGARGHVAFDLSIDVPTRLNRFGRLGQHNFLGNALPVLAVRDASGWKLDPDVGIGESFYTLTSDFLVRLNHPKALAVPATGLSAKQPAPGGRVTTVALARNVRDFAWAAGPFKSASATSPGGIRVNLHWTAGTASASINAVRREALAVMDDLGRRFGKYPYGEVDVVLSPGFLPIGSMEYPGFVLVAVEGTESATVHELAHQWWYGIVGNNEYADPWLDEGFAVYSQDLFYGEKAVGCWNDVIWDDDGQAISNSMGYWARHGRGWSFYVYFAGSCVLHELERTIGEAAMARLLKSYVRAHWHGVSTNADFKAAAAKISGRDLTEFWREHRIR